MSRKNKILILSAVLLCLALIPLAVRYLYGEDAGLLYREDYYYPSDDERLGVNVVINKDYHFADESEKTTPQPTVPREDRININTASAQELDEALPGIGEVKAAAIVAYREHTGGFRSIDELIEVEGIGEGILEKIRPYCVLSDTELD